VWIYEIKTREIIRPGISTSQACQDALLELIAYLRGDPYNLSDFDFTKVFKDLIEDFYISIDDVLSKGFENSFPSNHPYFSIYETHPLILFKMNSATPVVN
jgi:hypothetical protein